MKNLLREYRELDLANDTTTPYASPALLVRKKNGDPRLVVDFRKLNQQTIRMYCPLPDLDDHLDLIGGCKFFITLDLAQSYMQVPFS